MQLAPKGLVRLFQLPRVTVFFLQSLERTKSELCDSFQFACDGVEP